MEKHPQSTVQMIHQRRVTARGGVTEFYQAVVTIPRAVADEMDMNKGERLEWEVIDPETILIHRRDEREFRARQGRRREEREKMEAARKELLEGGWISPPRMTTPRPGPRRARQIVEE